MSNSSMVAVATNKSLLKEYKTNDDSRVVYLNDGDEFQIQLFNNTTYVVGAKISLNSEVLSGMIVLKPGERVWLERYLDTAKKFKFSTYNVEDGNSEVSAAIRNNGQISVRFYKEKPKHNNVVHVLNEPYYGGLCSSSIVYDSNPDVLLGCDLSNLALGDIQINQNEYTSLNTTVNSLATANTFGADTKPATLSTSVVETGRIDEGGYSNQKLETVNNEFESWAFRTEYVKILPASRKPYTASDAQKVYCTQCGRKLNPKYKFCPYCGAKVELIEEL